jgi:hypothetical protein
LLRNAIAARAEIASRNVLNNTISRLNKRAEKLNAMNISSSRVQANINARINNAEELRTRIASRLSNGVDAQ